MTRRLTTLFHKHFPPERTEGIQTWMVVLGTIGMIVAPFLPLKLAVVVINEVSMLTLVVGGIAGVDSARPNKGGQ